jgi:hypothetical protein
MKNWRPATKYRLQISSLVSAPALFTLPKRTTGIARSFIHLLQKGTKVTIIKQKFFVPNALLYSVKLARISN